MKKFLSLVLALVMTMSLVTISAGATEYKDLTDKDEIQYEEAVAVLNRIGVITGYDDGSFRPETELTRGAAAKIIVSLLIGPEAASNLPNTYAPYPDVPAGHTFAGVISYCKTAKIISGYGDGTFKPSNTLTGFAFAKMLLGAVGYDADLERFVDTGWTMNVASVGQSAGLFDRLQFDGSAPVTREQACQLALNALKATVVQYSQGLNVNVTGDNTNVVVSGGQTRSYKTSNQEFARNIRTRQGTSWGGSLINNIATDYYTVEFAEEHFVDLRLEHDKWDPTHDEFGRPSSEWSYKKVTIGTYALEPDFEFTTQIAHKEATEAARERATGLGNYDLDGTTYTGTGSATRSDTTTLWFNGEKVERGETSRANKVAGLTKIHEIADLTDNGNLVQVYVSNYDADFITDVVVIQTQLMEVKRVNSEYVSLDLVSPASKDEAAYGYNLKAIHEDVANVRVDDEPFAVLSTLKEGDKVAVIPVADNTDGREYSVSRAYVPETVTGELQEATTYSNVGKDRNAVDVTVAGTTYKVANWSKDLVGIDANKIKITRKDVTLLLDEYGNALLGKDVGEDSEYMVVGNWAQTLMNGRLVNLVEGWTVGGEAVSLNVGTKKYDGIVPGDLVKYTSANTTGSAEWTLLDGYTYDGTNSAEIYQVDRATGDESANVTASASTLDAEIKSSNVRVALEGFGTAADPDGDAAAPFANDVKFIYVDFDDEGDVESIEIIKGRQNVSTEDLCKYNEEYRQFDWAEDPTGPANSAEAYVKDGFVKAVVIKTESGNPNGQIAYVANYIGQHGVVNENGLRKAIYGYEVIMPDADGKLDMLELYTTKDYSVGTFIRYTKTEAPAEVTKDVVKENFYNTSAYTSTEKATSVALVQGVQAMEGAAAGKYSKNFVWFWNAFKTGNQDVLEDVVDANGKAVDALLPSIDENGDDLKSGYTSAQLAHNGVAAIVSGYRGLGDSLDNINQYTLSIDADKNNWFDLRDINYRDTISSVEDLEDYVPESISLAIVFNDKADADNFRSVSRVIVLHATPNDSLSKWPAGTSASLSSTAAGEGLKKEADGTYTVEDGTKNVTLSASCSAVSGAVKYLFTWNVGGKVYEREVATNESTLVLAGSELVGKEVTCSVKVLTKDKDLWSVAKLADGKVVFNKAPEAPETIGEVSYKASAAVIGQEMTFTPTVKDKNGKVVSSASLAAGNMSIKWGKIEGGEFKAFTQADLTRLGATVDPETGVLTFADAAKADGLTISCQVVQTVKNPDGTETETSKNDAAQVQATVTTIDPATGEETVTTSTPKPVDPVDDPAADTYTVTFEIGAGAKVEVDGRTLTNSSKNKTVVVEAGNELTFAIGVSASGAGTVKVLDAGGYTLGGTDPNYAIEVNKSGTIKVGLTTLEKADVLEALEAHTAAELTAPLHDQSDQVPDNALTFPDTYKVTASSNGVSIAAKGLVEHKGIVDGQQKPASWTGINFPIVVKDAENVEWTLTKINNLVVHTPANNSCDDSTHSCAWTGTWTGDVRYAACYLHHDQNEQLEVTYALEEGGEVTIEIPVSYNITTLAEEFAATIEEANFTDFTADDITGGHATGYGVSAVADSEGVVQITLTADTLQKHMSGNDTEGYWIGFKPGKTLGSWSVNKYFRTGYTGDQADGVSFADEEAAYFDWNEGDAWGGFTDGNGWFQFKSGDKTIKINFHVELNVGGVMPPAAEEEA